MQEQLTPFNPADLLDNNDDCMALLSEAYQDDDPTVFIIALGHVAKRMGMAQLALQTGLNRESLYKTFNGTTQPKWDTVQRVLKALQVPAFPAVQPGY